MSINTNELRKFADKMGDGERAYLYEVASELDATRTERNLARQAALRREKANWSIKAAPFQKPLLVWFPQVKLGDDGEPTDQEIGGAWCVSERSHNDLWSEPDWLDACGDWFGDDRIAAVWYLPDGFDPAHSRPFTVTDLGYVSRHWCEHGNRPYFQRLEDRMKNHDRLAPGMMWVKLEDGTRAVRAIACREDGGKGLPMRNVPDTLPGERVEWLYGDPDPLIINLGDHA